MSSWWVIALFPFIAALIGWLTNFIAVKMLFYPRDPIKILFFTIQGVFPKRQEQVALKVGKMVAEQLLSSKDIQAKINNSSNLEKMVEQVEQRIDFYFDNSFPEKYPLISRLMSQKAKTKIKDEMLSEISTVAPTLINQQIENLEQSLDIEKMISTKVKALSSEKLEDLIWSILDKEFKFIELIGAVIGFFIGLLQVLLTVLTQS